MKDAKHYTKRLLDLQVELIKFSEIERLIYYPDGNKNNKRENDTEHSYNLAITAWYLSQYFPELDSAKLIKFSLAHDFVEIHAGDVMAIGRTPAEQEAKEMRENEALKTLKKDWKDFQYLTETIDEYESKKSPEANFIYALDKIMPMMLNLVSEGKTWKKLNINRTDVIKNKEEKTKVSPEVYKIWKVLEEKILENDDFFNEDKR